MDSAGDKRAREYSGVRKGIKTLIIRECADIVLNSVECTTREVKPSPLPAAASSGDPPPPPEESSEDQLVLDLNRIEAVTRLMCCMKIGPDFKDLDNTDEAAILCRCLRPIPDTVTGCETPFCCQACRNGACLSGAAHDKTCQIQNAEFELEWKAINAGERPVGVTKVGWDGWKRLDNYVVRKRTLDGRSTSVQAACEAGYFAVIPHAIEAGHNPRPTLSADDQGSIAS